MSSDFICITGNTATGTTTLARRLSAYSGWNVYFSDDYLNRSPYFERFLLNPAQWAFHNQVFFLAEYISSYYELIKHSQKPFFLDYSIYELKIYTAAMREIGYLEIDESDAVERLWDLYKQHISNPVKVIYLKSSTDVIVNRLLTRGRKNENGIDRLYIDALQKSFDNYFFEFSECPLLTINSAEVNFFDEREVYKIIDQIL